MAMNFIYNVQIEKNKKKMNPKVIASVSLFLFGVYQVFTDVGQKFLQFIGAMIDFLPVFAILMFLLLLFFVKPIQRYYYLHKYSEQFREKFQYEKKKWLGQL